MIDKTHTLAASAGFITMVAQSADAGTTVNDAPQVGGNKLDGAIVLANEATITATDFGTNKMAGVVSA